MGPVFEDMLWDLLLFLGRYGHQSVEYFENQPITRVYAACDALMRHMSREGKSGGGASFHESAVSGGG